MMICVPPSPFQNHERSRKTQTDSVTVIVLHTNLQHAEELQEAVSFLVLVYAWSSC